MKLTSEVKKRLKNDLVCFRDVVLVNDPKFECEPGDFHFQLSDLLLHETSHVAIEMFRESGKSSYALRAYPLHCLAYPSKDRDFIVIIKQNQTTASAKLKDIITESQVSLKMINNTYNEKMVVSFVDTLDFGGLRHWQVGGA